MRKIREIREIREIRTYISDKYHRAIIKIELFFTRNSKEREDLWVAYGLYSVEGRKLLAEAMVEGVRKELENDIIMPNNDTHSGDCTIYAALINGRPEDGICTCGYGHKMVREGNWDHMYSEERKRVASHCIEYFKEYENLVGENYHGM